MMQRGRWTLALAVTMAACAPQPPKVVPPPVVVTVPPKMPVGGYPGLKIAPKRPDGTYVTPNFEMTDAAAVWHLRGALNVAALACDKAGGGVVDGYNAWLHTHSAVLAAAAKRYTYEWQITGWSDWQDAYDANETRLYNFYSQSTIRVAFCAAARDEIVRAATVTDPDMPAYARAALARLDKPFIDFFTAFDAWRDYNEPKVTPPPVVPTVSGAQPAAATTAPPGPAGSPPGGGAVSPPPVRSTTQAGAGPGSVATSATAK